MSLRDRPVEDYEDALFRLLMAKAAREESEELEKALEEMKKDPKCQISESQDRKWRRLIERLSKKQAKRARIRKVKKAAQRVAVAVCLLMCLLVTAYASIPQVRSGVLSLLTETTDIDTRLSFGQDTGEEDNSLLGYVITGLPEGFEKVYENIGNQAGIRRYEYENKYIELNVTMGNKDTIFGVNTEDIRATSVSINGLEGLIIDDGDRICASWGDIANSTFLELICIGFSQEEMIALAESVEYTG